AVRGPAHSQDLCRCPVAERARPQARDLPAARRHHHADRGDRTLVSIDAADTQPLLDFASSDERAGFRLHRLEVLNWGTFDQHVWRSDLPVTTVLLTGDSGSGKSPLLVAIYRLLVPPQR